MRADIIKLVEYRGELTAREICTELNLLGDEMPHALVAIGRMVSRGEVSTLTMLGADENVIPSTIIKPRLTGL